MRPFKWRYLIGVSCCLAVIAGLGLMMAKPAVVTESEWSIGIYEGKSIGLMKDAPGVRNPVLKGSDVNDVKAMFVADPFLMEKDSQWFLFFEVFNEFRGKGEIGMARSADGKKWKYQRIVLSEPFHISYPYVFEYNGEIYMIPESAEGNQLRLYKSTNFPEKWQFEKTLLSGSYGDHEIFQYNNRWWLFVGAAPSKHNVLKLFYADSLTGPWVEHPKSPVVKDNPEIARPGGRIVFEDGKMYRLAQDCKPTYGSALQAFEIIRLTPEDYAEKRADFDPVLKAGKERWNRHGMHHMDAHRLSDGEWLASVDGYKKTMVIKIDY
jgi:beta-xylosidase